MVRQFADVGLAQLPMPVEDQGRHGTVAQKPAQARLSHAAFLHEVLQHGQRVAISGLNVVVFPVIRYFVRMPKSPRANVRTRSAQRRAATA